MRAVVWTGPDRIEALDVELPEVPEGWALVRVERTGLCGTDLAILHGMHPRAAPPLVMGHEVVGTVAESRDDRLAVGELVIAEPLISCGSCWACSHGNSHVCRELGLYGIDAPGGLAEYVALPARRLHVLPPGTDATTAALIEPLAVAVHSVSHSALVPGDSVLIFGAGPIGVLTGLVALHEGAGSVAVVEPNRWRAQIADDLGFTVLPVGSEREAIRASTDGEGADVTFDTAGHPSVAPLLAECTRVLGTIVVVGVHKEPAPLDLRRINFAEQRLQGVRVYTTADVRRAIQLATSGALELGRLPVRVFPLDEAMEAFAAAGSGERNLKTMVSPQR